MKKSNLCPYIQRSDVRQHLRKIVVMAQQYGKQAVANVLEDMLELDAFRSEYVEHRLMNIGIKKTSLCEE